MTQTLCTEHVNLHGGKPAHLGDKDACAVCHQTGAAYAHLIDPQEREWLTALAPQDVLANAHRIYDWMEEQGIAPDSYTRELAFSKAAAITGIDYNTIYDAWMYATPMTKVG